MKFLFENDIKRIISIRSKWPLSLSTLPRTVPHGVGKYEKHKAFMSACANRECTYHVTVTTT